MHPNVHQIKLPAKRLYYMIAIDRFKAYFNLIYLPPIIVPALSIIGGILWGSANLPWFIPLLIALFIWLYCSLNNILVPHKLLICGMISTLAILSYHSQIKESLLAQWHNHPVTLYGTVTDIQKMTNSRYKYRITLKLEKLYDNQKTHNVNQSLWIYLHRKPYLMVADTVRLKNVKLKPIKNKSFKNYLIKEGIAHTLFLTKKNTIKHIYRPRYSLRRFVHSLKTNVLARITKKMNSKTGSLFSSVFLGKKTKSKINEQTKEQFKMWGLSHYLARSGLHLVIFIMIWELLLGLLPISFLAKQLLCLSLAFLYATLSWSTTSFIRALGTFFIYKMSLMANAQIHAMHVIILIGSVLLLFNPMLLFFVDFQLSFLFTLALSWIMQSYNDCVHAS